MTADLARYVAELGLSQHHKYLMGIARPAIEIIAATTAVSVGCSKLGGSPDLPASAPEGARQS
jgi:hypothetical protein